MEPTGSSAGDSGSVLTDLRICSSVKSKHLASVHSCGVSYKKSKKPAAVGGVINTSTGPLSLEDLGEASTKPVVSWDSDVSSIVSSMSGLSNTENMMNLVAEKTSYIESGKDNDMDEAMPKKTCTRTYTLSNLMKQPLFNNVSNDDSVLEFFLRMLSGSNQLPPFMSHVLKTQSFDLMKSFALNIELSVMSGKLVSDKLIAVKKIFYQIDDFEGVSTPSKFPGIIRSSFTSENSLIKARKMAVSEKILVNNDVKKANSHSDREVIVKEIPVDLLKSAIKSVFSKFGEIVSIKMQLIASLVVSEWSVFMRKDSVHVALAIGDKQTWVLRDQHQALLYTLLVGTTAHDLSNLLNFYGGKTCIVGHNLLAAISSVLIFKGVSLHWAGFFLACCAMCKHFSYVLDMCSVSGNSGRHDRRVITPQNQACLADIYKKRQVPIAHPVFFGGKTWAQVAGGSLFHVVPLVVSGAKLFSNVKSLSIDSDSLVVAGLNNCLMSLKCSLELLANQVFGILKRLSSAELVPLSFASLASLPVISASLDLSANLNMVLDAPQVFFSPPVTVIDNAASDFGSNSSKILTTKVGGLESKMMALDAVVGTVLARLDLLCSGLGSGLVWKIAICNVRGINNPAKQDDIICWHNDMNNLILIFTETKLKGRVHLWIVNKFDDVRVFTSGLDSGYLGVSVVIVMNSSLVKHVCKVSEMPGWLLSIKLLFKNKLLVSILGLYAGASSVVQFFQAGKVNSLIAKAVNESSFIVLGDDFNKNGLCKSTSFRKCLDLELINSLSSSPIAKCFTWKNSRGAKKTINYMFVSSSLVSAIVHCDVLEVGEHYDTDHQTVFVSISLDGLLDVQINFLRKQANKDCWKFDFKSAILANTTMFSDEFATSAKFSDLDAMWDIVRKIMVLLASKVFKRKWFKGFDYVFTKKSSRFHKLELLVFKIVKASREECVANFESLMGHWVSLDNDRTSFVQDVVNSGASADGVCFALFSTKRSYRASKLAKSLRAKEANIRSAIDKRMESFEVVLDHLVVGDELVLEPDLVKSKTRKRVVVDDAFFGVMCAIDFDELYHVVSNLPNGKATGLSGISNELWKYCDESVLASEFFQINNISINNDKTMAIPINSRVSIPFLSISGSPIFIAKKGESHRYLGIFLLTEGLSKPSLAKTNSDVCFFTNLVLRKAVSDKQFLYLVSAVLHPIISYRMQFSFVLVDMCTKWDVLICKNLKLKSGLLLDFPSDTIHHPSFYGLKSFLQCQSECKIALLVSFINFSRILGCLFSHRSHDLQVLCWWPIHLLISPTHICVNVSNNFLAGVVSILLDCRLSLDSFLTNAFWFRGGISMSVVLDNSLFFKFLLSLWHYGIVFVDQLQNRRGDVFSWLTFKWWKRLDPYGPVPEWFKRSVKFFVTSRSSPSVSVGVGLVDICGSNDFMSVCDHLSQVGADSLFVYTNRLLKNLGMTGCKAGAAAFFENINLGLDISV
ncbi:hypothetical protein G9A89_022137 [Geosiphon pyriformis]|nr:hypothetical protein G9A89_022137 [Geosiphon pyriformis]